MYPPYTAKGTLAADALPLEVFFSPLSCAFPWALDADNALLQMDQLGLGLLQFYLLCILTTSSSL